MNATSRAILQTVLSTDSTLSAAERAAAQRLIDGQVEIPAAPTSQSPYEVLMVTQKRAAEILSVCRATIWRMTKDGVLHPVEIIPGTWRYSFREIAELVREGTDSSRRVCEGDEKSAA